MISPESLDRAAKLGAAMRRSGRMRADNVFRNGTPQHVAWDNGYMAEARADNGQGGVVVHVVVNGEEDPDYDINSCEDQ